MDGRLLGLFVLCVGHCVPINQAELDQLLIGCLCLQDPVQRAGELGLVVRAYCLLPQCQNRLASHEAIGYNNDE